MNTCHAFKEMRIISNESEAVDNYSYLEGDGFDDAFQKAGAHIRHLREICGLVRDDHSHQFGVGRIRVECQQQNDQT